MSEAFTTWLAAELNRLNWTHAELAAKAGVSRGAVSNTLRGVIPPSCEFCIKTANALDVAPETVLKLAGILPPGPPASPIDSSTLQALVELARTLPPEQQEQLLAYCRFLVGQSH